jgi:hypothetical protein
MILPLFWHPFEALALIGFGKLLPTLALFHNDPLRSYTLSYQVFGPG